MAPMTRLPPPTNCPKVETTLPGLPVVRISLVEDTLSAILKIVVNKSKVGKNDISSTSVTKITFISTMRAIDIFSASIRSSTKEGIGMMKKNTAASIYSAIPTSDFLIILSPSFLFI